MLSLGETPLANALLPADAGMRFEPRYPLTLAVCAAVATLAQITETIAPEALFSEYLYFSSFSDAMVAHGREIAERRHRQLQLDPGSLVRRNRQQRRISSPAFREARRAGARRRAGAERRQGGRGPRDSHRYRSFSEPSSRTGSSPTATARISSWPTT